MLIRLLGSLLLLGTILAAQRPVHGPMRPAPAGWEVAAAREIVVPGVPGAVSPDGAWIAGRGATGGFCLWAVPDLMERCRHDVARVNEASIAWSPNGRYVAFAQAGAGFDSDIFLYDLRTQTRTNLTDDGIDEMGNPEEGGKYGTFDQDPVWSPASDEILFRRSHQPLLEQDFVSLMRVRVDTGQVIRVHDIVAGAEFGMLAKPLWLPDDTILFSVWENVEVEGLWRVGVDGSHPQRLPLSHDGRALAMPIALDATPQGDRVVIHAWNRLEEMGPDQITNFWLDLASGTLEPVRTAANAQLPIRLSPDGTALVYATGHDMDATIIVEDIDTGATTVVIEHAALWGRESLDGLAWTESDHVLIPGHQDAWLLVTLEPAP